MGDFLVNDFPRYVVLFAWILTNVFLFGYFCYVFESEPKWFYLRLILKRGLCLARGSAACLNFNCMLILIPVCRNLISFIRGSGRSVRRTVRRLLDKSITFHKIIAWAIVFLSAIHTGSHFWNYERICYVWNEVPGMRCIPSDSQPVSSPGPLPINVMWTTWAGITGHIILVALFLMVTSSIEIIRRSYFEVFWYTHHLFVVFYACLIIHGFQGLLKGQTNADDHHAEECYNTFLQGDSCLPAPAANASCRPGNARFAAGGAQTWKWVVGPLGLYLFERLIRFYRAQQRVVVTKVVQHPSKTIEIQMQKRGFFAEAGQYIFMQVPEVSALEWHPFTLTSSPEEKYFSVHIRVVGDWTEALAKRLGVGNEEFQQSYDLPDINVDGPFGTASEDIFRFRIGVCIGAGIGVTPFASILKSIWYQRFGANREEGVGDSLKLKKVYVYWICPDTQAFEWFADLLKTLEEQLIENGMADFLDYNIYLTRGWDQNLAKNIMLHEDDSRDVITGLQQKTHFGRPVWSSVFESMAAAHRGEDIGVFFCGPKVLSGALHLECNRCTDLQNGTRFYYNKENF